MSRNIHCTFVSEKVSKIRWRPSVFNNAHSFVTGGWDNNINSIRLWDIKPSLSDEDDGDTDINPYEIKELLIHGDITELKFVNSDRFVASTSLGDVYLLRIEANEYEEINISEQIAWKQLHKTANSQTASCSSFAVYDNDIATVGSDGLINLLSASTESPTQIIKDADSCPITCVEFLKFNEIITSNCRGLFKIWDLRSPTTLPDNTFMLRNDLIVSVTCLTHHPTQRHILACGDEYGGLTFWDLRQNTYPLNTFSSHSECVNEILFHPDRPDQVFSCSDAGDLFHWTGLKQGASTNEPFYLNAAASGGNKYDAFTLMPELHLPVNCIDFNRDKLLCGGDNEAMYLIEDVNIYGLYENTGITMA